MYKRLELHNHTKESDAILEIRELLDIMIAENVAGFGLTDHNTISGHDKMKQAMADYSKEVSADEIPLQCIYGMEYTTYYGHILCLNLHEYVPWENINPHQPELLFEAASAKGALVGIAHPYAFGAPFSKGCRFEMTVTNYETVDFIEIFNNAETLSQNKKALELWESLVLQGEKLAATAGMDLHRHTSMVDKFATFIRGEVAGNVSSELEDAIYKQKTWVSKGIILETTVDESGEFLTFNLVETEKTSTFDTSCNDMSSEYIVVLKTEKGTHELSSLEKFPIENLAGAQYVIPKLYSQTTEVENLVCVSPVVMVEK